MKYPLLAAALVALGGCASTAPVVLNAPVGPAHAAVHLPEGQLVVYTFSYPGATYGETEYLYHTPYTIYAPDGKLVQAVVNQSGPMFDEPTTVHLPAGKYSIKAEAEGIPAVVVPVVIERDQTTIVDLNKEWWHDHALADQPVKLPNGAVVGAAAN